MSFWSRAFQGKPLEEEMKEDAASNTRSSKRSVESPTTNLAKSRRSKSKKANNRPSPNKDDDTLMGDLTTVTPGTKLKNSSKSSIEDTNTSRESNSDRIIDGLQKHFERIIQELQVRRPKGHTEDTYLHAMAVILEIPINFNECNIEIKIKLMEDFIYLLSDPAFKRDTLYIYDNMDALSEFVYIPKPKSARPSFRSVKSTVDKMIHALLTHQGRPIEEIHSHGWDALCQITGIFISPDSLSPLDKAALIQKIITVVDTNKFKKRRWYNRHAISTLLFYYGQESRPVANTSEEKIIPPLFTDKSFSIDARRAAFYQWSATKEHHRPSVDFSKYKTDEWCASATLCHVDIFDALFHVCAECSFPVHPQCASYIAREYFCYKCKPDYHRQCWSCFSNKYIELPKQKVEPADEPFDAEVSIIEKEPTHNHKANVTVQLNSSNVIATQSSEDKRQVNKDMVEVNNLDELEQNIDPLDEHNEVQSPNDTRNSGNGKFNLTSVLNDHASAPGFSDDVRRKLNLDDIDNSKAKDDAGHSETNNLVFVETRADVSFQVLERQGSDESTVIQSAKPFIEKLLEIDPNARILPWKESKGVQRLVIDDLAQDYDSIQVYFNRARLRDDSIKIYCDIRIAHTIPWDAISISMRDWLQNNKCGLYYKKLQVENTRTLGWFLWSHRNIKADRLAQVLANDYDLQLYFRYSKIYLGRGEKFAPDEGVKALIAICESTDFKDLNTALKSIYHQSKKEFPLGIKMRFMPQTTNEDEDILLRQQIFRAQQEQFLTTIRTAISTEIRLLDASVQNRKTLRNHIMNLVHPNSLSTSLFLCVDSQWNNGSRFIFTYIQSHENEAKRMVNTLAAYMIKKKGEDVLPYFTSDAIENAKTLHWDEKHQYFMSVDESYYLEMDVWTDELALQLDTNAVTSRITNACLTTENVATRIERIYTGNETCSVGTVSSKIKTKRLTGTMESDSEATTKGDNDSMTTIGSNSVAKQSTKDKVQKSERKLEVMAANQTSANNVLVDMSVILDRLQTKFLGTSTESSKQKSVSIEERKNTNYLYSESTTDITEGVVVSDKQQRAEGILALGDAP